MKFFFAFIALIMMTPAHAAGLQSNPKIQELLKTKPSLAPIIERLDRAEKRRDGFFYGLAYSGTYDDEQAVGAVIVNAEEHGSDFRAFATLGSGVWRQLPYSSGSDSIDLEEHMYEYAPTEFLLWWEVESTGAFASDVDMESVFLVPETSITQ